MTEALPYRKHSIDLLWFLYDRDARLGRVNTLYKKSPKIVPPKSRSETNFQGLQEDTLLIKLQAAGCKLIKTVTPKQVFSCKFCGTFHLCTATSSTALKSRLLT